jgi:DNA-binding CsgD family transcriptional regulator
MTAGTAAARMLERDAELRAVAALLEDARAGRGRTLAIEAPPGLGKSTLAEHAATAGAATGLRVLRAAGRELERGLGWGVARSLFEPWLLSRPPAERDELLAGPAAPARALLSTGGAAGDGLSATDASFGILHGLFWLAVRAAEREPLLLLVDDAHWADEPSLQYLLYLQGRIRDQPLGVLVAARSGEAGAGGLLAQLVADPGTTVVEPSPLTPEAVAALVRGGLAAADERFCRRCHELTAGNPLQVHELVTAAAESPGDQEATVERAARSLSRSVLRRLGSLPEPSQALARAVAVFEGGVALHLAATLAGLSAATASEAADRLQRADILTADDPLEFVHPLVRAAIYGALGRHARAATHARAGRLLVELGAPPEQAGAHLLEAAAASDEAVVAALRRAAATALRHGVPESAIAYLERALREPPSAAARADVLADLGRAELLAGRSDAVAHLEAAIALVEEPRRRAALRLELGRTLHDFGRLEEACGAFERGAADLGRTVGGAHDGDELATDLTAWYLTSAMLLDGRAADAHRRVDAILAHAERAGTRAERALVSKALIMRVYEGAPADGLVALAHALYGGGRLLEEDGVGSQALGHVIVTLSYCDEYAAASELMGRALARTRRQGFVTWYAAMRQLAARQTLWTGPLADAVEDAAAAVELFAAGRHMYLPAAAYCLIRGLVESGRLDEAEAALARLGGAAAAVGPFAGWRDEAAGRLAAARGDAEAALAAFRAVGGHVRPMGVANPSLFHWRSEAGLAALRLGREELARELIEEERALAERFGAPRALGVALRASGLLERGEAAVEHLRAAAALHERCGAHAEHALTLAELGGAVRRAGRPGEARETLRLAIAVAERVGAAPVVRRATEELERAGGHAPARADHARELTPSERRVARLAATGRSNRAIANELFVTVKAVEWHLGNAYRKLDIRGRGGLAAALAAREGDPA